MKVHARSGVGDVVATVGEKRIRAECKGGPLVTKPGSREYPKLQGALGQVVTVERVDAKDILAVAVPFTTKFRSLADRWREAPLVVQAGICYFKAPGRRGRIGFRLDSLQDRLNVGAALQGIQDAAPADVQINAGTVWCVLHFPASPERALKMAEIMDEHISSRVE